MGIYGRAHDILRKTDEELLELKANGMGIIYVGVESGNPEILKKINKGETREELIEAVRKAEALGIETSLRSCPVSEEERCGVRMLSIPVR